MQASIGLMVLIIFQFKNTSEGKPSEFNEVIRGKIEYSVALLARLAKW